MATLHYRDRPGYVRSLVGFDDATGALHVDFYEFDVPITYYGGKTCVEAVRFFVCKGTRSGGWREALWGLTGMPEIMDAGPILRGEQRIVGRQDGYVPMSIQFEAEEGRAAVRVLQGTYRV